jgi:hypothetical protein
MGDHCEDSFHFSRVLIFSLWEGQPQLGVWDISLHMHPSGHVVFSHDNYFRCDVDGVSHHVGRRWHYIDSHSSCPVGGCEKRWPRLRIDCGYFRGHLHA